MDNDFEIVAFGRMPRREWLELTARDPAAFGTATAGLIYLDKEQHLGLRDPDGRLVGVLGMAIVPVEVEGAGSFDVVGMGSLIVAADQRGRSLSERLSVAAREIVATLGPDRAMLFCEPSLIELHGRRGYTLIDAPVFVDQPDGRIEMPIPAMWRPIRPSTWPPGRVDVHGLPF